MSRHKKTTHKKARVKKKKSKVLAKQMYIDSKHFKTSPRLTKACQKLPPFSRAIAALMIPGADNMHGVLSALNEPDSKTVTWPPETQKIREKAAMELGELWHCFYRNPSLSMLAAEVGMGEMGCNAFVEALNTTGDTSIAHGKRVVQALPKGDVAEFLRENVDAANDKLNLLEKQDALAYRIVFNNLIGFLAVVFMPCIFFYESTPFDLLVKARRGDLQSFAKLLQLDKRILGVDPVLQRRWFAIMSVGSPTQRDILVEALAKPPVQSFAPQRTRVRIAAMIACVGELEDRRIKPKTLRNLFDAAVKDKNPNVACDKALPAGQAFGKAVSREREDFNQWLFKKPPKAGQEDPPPSTTRDEKPDKSS